MKVIYDKFPMSSSNKMMDAFQGRQNDVPLVSFV